MQKDGEPDLMPPAFSEGLEDWSRGDGTPDSPTYATAANARLAQGDGDFGVCLELRTAGPVQRLRYMGEVPLARGAYLEVSARLKAVRGPLPTVRIAAWPGGAGGKGVRGLATATTPIPLAEHGAIANPRAVIGPEEGPGVDLVWDARVLYAHMGLDLIGPGDAVVRIEAIRVRDVTRSFAPQPLPGFGPANVTAAPVEKL